MNVPTKLLTLAGIGMLCILNSNPAIAQKKNKKDKKGIPAAAPVVTPKKEGIKSFSDLINDKAKVKKGPF
ncbi:hypothetical protein [Pedobacter antarcticus]|uniref:hypothetical protein n=1 Tax=Pedobacter antarcticus TaxID=34086 RepID=UPI000B0E2259|nr:hypothetical protein [Pedobacter antarcticus]